jgi:hypothetical protein
MIKGYLCFTRVENEMVDLVPQLSCRFYIDLSYENTKSVCTSYNTS